MLNKIKFAIIKNKVLDNTYIRKDFEYYYLRNNLQNHIDIDSISDTLNTYDDLEEMYDDVLSGDLNNYDIHDRYLVFVWEGVLLNNANSRNVFLEPILNFIKNTQNDWVVSGHVFDEYESMICHKSDHIPIKSNKYFKLYPIMMIINVDKWLEIGSPELGKQEIIDGSVIESIEISPEHIHDNYTPLWICKSKENEIEPKSSTLSVDIGWNIINESMKHNLTVRNIPQEIRNKVWHTYPENDTNFYIDTVKMIRSGLIMDQSKHIHNRLYENLTEIQRKNFLDIGFSLFNSEEIIQISLWSMSDIQDIDCVIGPCQGFKDFIYTRGKHYSKNNNIKYIHFDLDDNIINIKQMFINTWNGEYDTIVSYYKSLIKDDDMLNDPIVLNEKYNELINYFNNDMIDQWNIYKNLEHHYIVSNILESSSQSLLSLIEKLNCKKVLFLFSDIFNWRSNYIYYGFDNLENKKQKLFNDICNITDSLVVEGKGIDEIVDWKKIK